MNDRLGNHKKTCTYGLFLLASVVYICGLSPTIAWRDSAEFIPVVHTLGISHPAGSPTYTLLTKPMTFLPIGSIALRVNMFSALLGALSIALLFALLYELLAESPPWARVGAALSGALFLLLSESFWRFSEVAEVYTLQNCLLVILMMLLLKARQARTLLHASASHFYWLFAFLYGLSAGVHVTMALFAPAFLLFIGLTEPSQFRLKGLAFLTFFFVLGFAVFLYLPLVPSATRSLTGVIRRPGSISWRISRIARMLQYSLCSLRRSYGTRYACTWRTSPMNFSRSA